VLAVVALVSSACGATNRGSPAGGGGGEPASPGPTGITGLTVDPSVSARVLVGGLGTLDDIAVAPDGTVYIGDESGGRLSAWSPSTGQVKLVASGLSHPEGIVVLDGFVVVCEQGTNQLSRVDPSDGTVSPFHALSNPAGKLGVDGLALDPTHPSIVVPDSPDGTLLRVGVDGTTATPIPVTSASQPPFNRPTGAFVRSDGSLLVADEDGGDIVLRRTDGSLEVLAAGLRSPDDVLGDDLGNVYTNTLGDGALHRIQGAKDDKLVAGLVAPHGLAFDLDGNVLVTDLGGDGRLIEIFVH
jgi:streptogramin lyase